jgi:hypothetical protein
MDTDLSKFRNVWEGFVSQVIKIDNSSVKFNLSKDFIMRDTKIFQVEFDSKSTNMITDLKRQFAKVIQVSSTDLLALGG